MATMKHREGYLAFVFLVLGVFSGASAQNPSAITLVSVSPPVGSGNPPPNDPDRRMSAFAFVGTLGTSYTAIFSAATEPATTIGVGADISSIVYDSLSQRFTVAFTFASPVVLETLPNTIPPNEFQIIIDPGDSQMVMPPTTPPRALPPQPGKVTECYGPANTSKRLPGQGGPPLDVRGSFMSTNLRAWCEIPPSASNPFFGFKFLAPSGARGFLKKKIPAQLRATLSQLSGKTLGPNNVALYNGNLQASRAVTETGDGGLLVNIAATFNTTLNTVTAVTGLVDAAAKPEGVGIQASTVAKSFATAAAEALSLTPSDSVVKSSRATVFGSIGDLTQAKGQTVKIYKKSGSSLKALSTTKLTANGTYTKSISSSTLFNGSSKATLIAKLVGGGVRQSRTVSLTKR